MSEDMNFLLPEKASTFIRFFDPLYYGYTYMALVILAVITLVVVLFAIRYRRKNEAQLAKKQITHNLLLEIIWTTVPAIIFMFLFILGWKGFIKMSISPIDSMQINVVGQKWKWTFNYENGASEDTLVIPENTNIKLLMTSRDVLHSVFIPAFRTKKDVLPNRYTTLWFNAIKKGSYHLFCTEFCGRDHSRMVTKVKVISKEAYLEWLKKAEKGPKGTPAEIGAILYNKKGCNACHSVDGSRILGPTWKGLWGSKTSITGQGKVLVDENYIRESITEPAVKIVESYPPVMPTYKGQLSDSEIDAIIVYIKTLK